MKRHNKIALALGAVGLVGLVVWALQPRPVSVETAVVTRGTFEQTVSDDGRTRVRDRYVVSAPLAGRVERISLKAGDAVKAGQVVALLRPTAPAFLDVRTERELQERIGTAEAQLLRARTEVARVAAQRDQSTADLDRATRLYREGFVSATAREQAQLSLKVAEKTVEAAKFGEEAARHELAQARAALTRYRSGTPGARWEVTAPVTGAVLKVVQESEGAVVLGAPLLELADLGSLEAIVEVLSQEAVAIQPGMAARVELGTGVPPLAARVRRIEPAAFTKISALGVEEQRVNVVLDFAEPLDRVKTLGDGFRVDADIVTHRVTEVVTVPVGALFRDGEGWAVFVVEGNRAVKRPVQVPRRNGVTALVEAGLKPGEKVVVYPGDSLKDGARVVVGASGTRPATATGAAATMRSPQRRQQQHDERADVAGRLIDRPDDAQIGAGRHARLPMCGGAPSAARGVRARPCATSSRASSSWRRNRRARPSAAVSAQPSRRRCVATRRLS